LALYRVEALVLRARPLGEADRVLTLFARDEGKLQAVARGSRRPRSRLMGATQPLCHGRYLLMSGRELDSVQQAELVDHGLRPLREDLRRMAAASVTAELVDALVEVREPQESLFRALKQTWTALAEAPPAALGPVVFWFCIHLMDRLGYAPVLDRCAGCGRELGPAEAVRFSAREGGSLCASCAAQRDAGAPLLKAEGRAALRHLRQHDVDAARRLILSPEGERQVRRALYHFIEYRLSAPSRAWQFWESLDELERAVPATAAGETPASGALSGAPAAEGSVEGHG